jgi:hypothetical protein
MNAYGISKTGFYTAHNKFLNAVLNRGELDIGLPTKASEWEKIRKGFASKSSNQVLTGCVGAIDGFFQPRKCPMVAESCGFPQAYFSGHYQSYGLNCQAICNSRLRLKQDGYNQAANTTGLFTHTTRPIALSLIVDNFWVK